MQNSCAKRCLNQDDVLVAACGIRKGEDKGIQGFSRKFCKESDLVEDIAIDCKLLLKWI
jgi:hypothetical protein